MDTSPEGDAPGSATDPAGPPENSPAPGDVPPGATAPVLTAPSESGTRGARFQRVLIWFLLVWQVLLTFFVFHNPSPRNATVLPQKDRLTLEDMAMGIPLLDLSDDLALTQPQARQLYSLLDSVAGQLTGGKGGNAEARDMLEAYIAKTILTPAQRGWIDQQKRILQGSSSKGPWTGYDKMVQNFRQFVGKRTGDTHEARLDSPPTNPPGSGTPASPRASTLAGSPPPASPSAASPALAVASPSPSVASPAPSTASGAGKPSPDARSHPVASPLASPAPAPTAPAPAPTIGVASPAPRGGPPPKGERLVLTQILAGIVAMDRDPILALDSAQAESLRRLLPDLRKALEAMGKGQAAPGIATVERAIQDLLRLEQKRYILSTIPESAPAETLISDLQKLLKARPKGASPSPSP